MEKIFFEITIVICIAAVLAIIFRFIKQPAILAYILTGVILGPLGFINIDNIDVLHSLGQIGITLLLFLLGLELKLNELRSVGRVVLITGTVQILFTSVVVYLICTSLGFAPISSIYMALALTFSSTIIIVKLLSDKKEIHSLYGKISVGILLVQDFVAIFSLIILSGFRSGTESITILSFVIIIVKAIILFVLVILISKTILPKLISKIAESSELLFLFSLAWVFGVSAFVSSPIVGFSIEIGGFLAGLALANSTENFQTVAKVKALRDFFITIFFVALGTSLIFKDVSQIWLPAIILASYVLIINPIMLTSILGLFGYKKRTSFLVGLTMTQISEFSIIVVLMGNTLNHIPDQVVSIITLAGTITFVLSSYMIMQNNLIYKKLSPFLSIFEKKDTLVHTPGQVSMTGHVVLVGVGKMGESILEALLKNKEDVIVVDFDPDVIAKLSAQKVRCIYGDIADFEIHDQLYLSKARLIISTITDIEDNLIFIKSVQKLNKKALIAVCAINHDHARVLYKEGVDYVVMPYLTGGRHLAKILVDDNHLELIEEYKARDRTVLELK